MASYDRATYSIRFNESYDEIQVLAGEEIYATFDLQATNQSVSVFVDGDDYIVSYTSSFEDATITLDVGSGTTLAFNNTRLEGITIADFRDFKNGPTDPVSASIDCNLECTPFRLKYVSGPFALKLYFTNEDCMEWDEME